MDFEDTPLFDLDLNLDQMFEVPAELKDFDREITQEEIESAGNGAFVAWLQARLKNQFVTTPAPLITTACEEEAEMPDDQLATFGETKVRANFFPEFPDAEDYHDGEANLEYRRLTHEADLGVAYAKIACDSCPIRQDCLNSSIVNFEEYGVWGGWSAGARGYIHEHFKYLKKQYIAFEKYQNSADFDETSEEFQSRLAFWADFMQPAKADLKASAEAKDSALVG